MKPDEVQVPEYPFPFPRPTIIDFIQLPEGQEIVKVQPYRVETKKPARWQFWRSEKIKYNLAVLTATGRFYIVDPDNLTVEEKNNNY